MSARARLLRRLRPQVHDRGVFPRHRAPFAFAEALLELLEKLLLILEIDLRLIMSVFFSGELPDSDRRIEAFAAKVDWIH